jgi:hypothetical protein
MGIPNADISFSYEGTAIFMDWTTTEGWLNEEAGNKDWEQDSHDDKENESVVDYALGAALPEDDFWFTEEPTWEEDSGFDCLELPDPSTQFDPNTDAVDLEYWTGNIQDYKLIIWRCPFSDETLWEDYLIEQGGDCDDDLNACQDEFHTPDSRHIFGGLPDWWEDVAEGTWQGRVVILLEGEEIVTPNLEFPSSNTDLGSGTRTMSALFVNTLADVTGMELDVSLRRTSSRLASCVNTYLSNSDPPDLEDLTSSDCENAPQDEFSEVASGLASDKEDKTNIMLGVEQLYGAGFFHNIEGGEPLAQQTSAFRDFCEEDDLDIDEIVHPLAPDEFTYTWTVPTVTETEQVSVARSVLTKNIDQNGTQITRKVEFVICQDWHVTDPAEVAEGQDENPADFTDFHKQFVKNLFSKNLMVDASVSS